MGVRARTMSLPVENLVAVLGLNSIDEGRGGVFAEVLGVFEGRGGSEVGERSVRGGRAAAEAACSAVWCSEECRRGAPWAPS